jgi:hypothetical protein
MYLKQSRYRSGRWLVLAGSLAAALYLPAHAGTTADVVQRDGK